MIWWKAQFGDDFYIEVMRHNQEDENRVNQSLIALAKKHNVKLIATNNTYYVDKEDANAHDILLCVKDGEKQATPIGRGRGYRYGLPQSGILFQVGRRNETSFLQICPKPLSTYQEIIDKIETYSI